MNKTKRGISIIIQILLICSIIFALLSIFLRVIVLNKNTYTNILDKNDTYEQVKESIYDKIDAVLSAKNINYDIKESIITEEDIRKEADTIISGLIDYLKTGENNIKPLDAEVYKQRVGDILQSIFGNLKSSESDLSYNDAFQGRNMAFAEGKFKINNMMVAKEQSQVGQSVIDVEKLMTREEAEAKVRELLKQKGLTEDEAIKKATEKGITEEQALKILEGYGITIDDEPKANESTSESYDNNISSGGSSDNGSNPATQESHDITKNSEQQSSAGSKSTNNIDPIQADKSIKSQLDNITSKLQDEAESSINKEVEKMDFDKILNSSKLQILAKLTSTMYKLFWGSIALPIIFIVMLAKINGKDFSFGLKYIRNAFLLSGLTLLVVPSGMYALKVYEKISISPAYLSNTVYYAIGYFSKIIIMYGAVTFGLGLLMFIPKIRNSVIK